jgi:hypothetical protein
LPATGLQGGQLAGLLGNDRYGAGQTNGAAPGSATAPWPWFFLAIDETHWP